MDKKDIIILVLAIIIVTGGLYLILQPKNNSVSTVNIIPNPTTRAELSQNFEALDDMGCGAIVEKPELETISGAEIINLGYPYFDLYSNESLYKITFSGGAAQKTFTLAHKGMPVEDFPYERGKYYKFEFRTICGPVHSSGHHGGGYIFVDNNFSVLEEVNY